MVDNREGVRKIKLNKETMKLLRLHMSQSHILEQYIFPHLRDRSQFATTKGMVDLMEETGIDRRFIYAFIKTDRLLTEQNLKYLTSEDKKEWIDAIEEYDKLISVGALNPSDSLVPFIKASKKPLNPKKGQSELRRLFDSRGLHRSIIEASRKSFLSNDFPGAVFNAYKKVLNDTKEKSGDIKEDGLALVTSAFNPKHPLLKNPLADATEDASIQEGIMHLFMWAVLSVRNVFAHKDVYLTNVDVTLEYLSFASFLCKILDVMKKQSTTLS